MSVISGLYQSGGLLSSIRFVDENGVDYYIVQAYVGETLVFDSRIFDFRIKSSVLMDYVSTMVLAAQKHLKLAEPFQITSKNILNSSQNNEALVCHSFFDIPHTARLFNKMNIIKTFEEQLYLKHKVIITNKDKKNIHFSKSIGILATAKCFNRHEDVAAKHDVQIISNQKIYNKHKAAAYYKQILFHKVCDFISVRKPAWYADFKIAILYNNTRMYSRASCNAKVQQILRFKYKRVQLKPEIDFPVSLGEHNLLMSSAASFIAVNDYLQSHNNLNLIPKIIKFDTDNLRLFNTTNINFRESANFILGKIKNCAKEKIVFSYNSQIFKELEDMQYASKINIKNNIPLQIMVADKIGGHYKFIINYNNSLSNSEVMELNSLTSLKFNILPKLSNNINYYLLTKAKSFELQNNAKLNLANINTRHYTLSSVSIRPNTKINDTEDGINNILFNLDFNLNYGVNVQNAAGKRSRVIRRFNKINAKYSSLKTEYRAPSYNTFKESIDNRYANCLTVNEHTKDVRINTPINTHYFVTFESVPKTGHMRHILQISPITILNTKVFIMDTITTPLEMHTYNIINASLARSQIVNKNINIDTSCKFITVDDFMGSKVLLNFENNSKISLDMDKSLKHVTYQEIQSTTKLDNINPIDMNIKTNNFNIRTTRGVITDDQLRLYARNKNISLLTDAIITAHDIDMCIKYKAFTNKYRQHLSSGAGMPTSVKRRFMRIARFANLKLGNKIFDKTNFYINEEMLLIGGNKKLTIYYPDLTKINASMAIKQNAQLNVFGPNDFGLRVNNNILISENLCTIDASALRNVEFEQKINLIPRITTDMPWTGLSFKVNEILAMKPDTVDMDAWLCPILIDDVLYIRQGYKINRNGNTLEVE